MAAGGCYAFVAVKVAAMEKKNMRRPPEGVEFWPMISADASSKSRRVWQTLFDEPHEWEPSWYVSTLLYTGIVGGVDVTAYSTIANGVDVPSVIWATLCAALTLVAVMVQWWNLTTLIARLGVSKHRGCLVRHQDFTDPTVVAKLNRQLFTQERDGLLVGGATAKTCRINHTGLPKRIGTWQRSLLASSDVAWDSELVDAAFVARALHDNEVRRLNYALEGKIASVNRLASEIDAQAAALDNYEQHLERLVADRRARQLDSQRAQLEAANTLDTADDVIVSGAGAHHKLEAAIELN